MLLTNRTPLLGLLLLAAPVTAQDLSLTASFSTFNSFGSRTDEQFFSLPLLPGGVPGNEPFFFEFSGTRFATRSDQFGPRSASIEGILSVEAIDSSSQQRFTAFSSDVGAFGFPNVFQPIEETSTLIDLATNPFGLAPSDFDELRIGLEIPESFTNSFRFNENGNGNIGIDFRFSPGPIEGAPVVLPDLGPRIPLQIQDASAPTDFGEGQIVFVPLPPDPNGVSPIGSFGEVTGSVLITRNNGLVEPVFIGTPVFQGDIVESNANGAANIAFVDDTNFAISEDARLSIDEYVFDPGTNEGRTDFSILKGIFVFVSDLIGREDPDDVTTDTPIGSIGFRAELDIPSLNPFEEDLGALLQAGSPATLSTSVDLEEGLLSLSLDYAIFDDVDGGITIEINGTEVGRLQAADATLGELGKAAFEFLSPNSGPAELSITYDGLTGSEAIVDNIAILTTAGVDLVLNGDFSDFDNGFFASGEGVLALAVLQTTAVPEPGAITLIAIACFVACPRRRCRTAGSGVASLL